MRLLGPTLVIAALVLSTGGVAYQTTAQADGSVGATPVEQVQVPASAADPEACEAPQARKMERVELDVTKQALKARKSGAVSLNTRGYNYTDPDPQPGKLPERPKPDTK